MNCHISHWLWNTFESFWTHFVLLKTSTYQGNQTLSSVSDILPYWTHSLGVKFLRPFFVYSFCFILCFYVVLETFADNIVFLIGIKLEFIFRGMWIKKSVHIKHEHSKSEWDLCSPADIHIDWVSCSSNTTFNYYDVLQTAYVVKSRKPVQISQESCCCLYHRLRQTTT